MKRTLALAALLLTCCSPNNGEPAIEIAEPWARETIAAQSATAAYLRIANHGDGPDRLVGVSAEAPVQASLHETQHSNGIARMRPVENGLEIAAGETVVFEPGGAHIMLDDMLSPVRAGDELNLTLHFERSGEQTVAFQVREARTPPRTLPTEEPR